jgi:hypothetical protein
VKKGPAWEAKVISYLREHGVPHAERRVTGGGRDRGDVAGIPGVVIEAKNAAGVALAAWVDEAEVERVNDGAALAVVWHHRRGRSSPGDGYVTMTGATLVALLRAAGYIAAEPAKGAA